MAACMIGPMMSPKPPPLDSLDWTDSRRQSPLRSFNGMVSGAAFPESTDSKSCASAGTAYIIIMVTTKMRCIWLDPPVCLLRDSRQLFLCARIGRYGANTSSGNNCRLPGIAADHRRESVQRQLAHVQ